MNAVASTSAHAMGNDELPKRKRKRTGTRKSGGGGGSAAAAASADDDHVAANENNDDDDAAEAVTETAQPTQSPQKSNAAPTQPPTAQPAAAEDDDDDDADDADEAGDASGKKKRRRNRKRSKKASAKDDDGASTQAAPTPVSTSALSSHLASVPDPNTADSTDLVEGSAKKAALCYAYHHHTSRETWKFQKAKEAWLIRHVLTVPPAESASTPATTADETTRTDTISGDGDDAQQQQQTQQHVDNSIPDTYLPLAVNYLSTMQGKGRERLVAEWQSVRDAPEPVAPVADNSEAVSSTPAPAPAPTSTSSTGKSVSFADVADDQMAGGAARGDNTDADAAYQVQEREWQWKRTRAAQVLQWLQ